MDLTEFLTNKLKLRNGIRRNRTKLLRTYALDYSVSEILSACRPLFILSTGRSGTRYIASSYYFDGRVCAYHKNSPELKELQRVLPDRPDLLEAMARISRGEQILAAEHANLRYIESNHHLVSFDVGLPRAFPAACFLYVQRPRSEYIASSLRRGSFKNAFIDRGKRYPTLGAGLGSSTPEFIGSREWDWCTERIEKIRSEVPGDQWAEVDLSSLDDKWPEICEQFSFPYTKLKGNRNSTTKK